MAKVTTTLTNGNDTKLFGADDDEVFALDGDDFIDGGAGNDILTGGDGVDQLYGGIGDDRFVFNIDDDSASDLMNGGDGFDTIAAVGGANLSLETATVNSIEAIDIVSTNQYATQVVVTASQIGAGIAANAVLNGSGSGSGSRNFVVKMGNAAQVDLSQITYSNWTAGSVTIQGDNDAETVAGTSGTDRFYLGGGNDVALGGSGDDQFDASSGDDAFDGGGGLDQIDYVYAAAGVKVNLATTMQQNTLGAGLDTISGVERVFGSAFADTLLGDAAVNNLVGSGGNDTIAGGAGGDTLAGGLGIDTLFYANSGAGVTVNLLGYAAGGDAQGDQISGFENAVGSKFADALTGDSGNNLLRGMGGADALDGGLGSDTAGYSSSLEAVTVSLDGTLAATKDAAGDTFVSIEHLMGSNLDAAGDRLRGDAGANTLSGLKGNDILEGGNGDDMVLGGDGADALIGGAGVDTMNGGNGADQLLGGAGADKLTGGDGGDVFRFDALSEGGDIIADFNGAFDFVKFKASAFAGLVAGQALTAAQFVAGAAPAASGNGGQFLYETDTGILTWDANGATAGGTTVIATLTGMPGLALDDFQIF